MTGQWAFVAAAYVVTAILTIAVVGGSWRAMTRAERRADAMKQDKS